MTDPYQIVGTPPSPQTLVPTRTMPWKLFFGPQIIPPHQTISVAVIPDRHFRWQRFVNKGDVDGLWVSQLFVGSKNENIKASVLNLTHGGHDADFKGTTASPGLSIQLDIENQSDHGRLFAGNLEGITIL